MNTPASRFRKVVWAYYRVHGRHDLPWRNWSRPLPACRQAYKILVSEVMLQQTQVERVIPFYKKFIKKFPTAGHLASASLASVLREWQGLGYNRRAKLLHFAAKQFKNLPFLSYRTDLVGKGDTIVRELESLSGVGPYTARAIVAFAYNQDVVFVETNIRTAVIHHFFTDETGQHLVLAKISDKEIEKILREVLPKGKSREWYSALMDYGAFLKRSGISHNAKSKKYTKQSKFSGSLREARGAILRVLTESQQDLALPVVINLLGFSRRAQLRTALSALLAEGLIQKRGFGFALPR